MTHIREFLKRSGYLTSAVLMVAAWVVGDAVIFTQSAHAAQLSSRSLKVSSSAPGGTAVGAAGSGTNGAQTAQTVTFTMGTNNATIGAIAIIYCDNPIPTTACTSSTAVTGNAQNITSASVTGSGLGGSGWALDTTTNNPTITNYGTCNGATTTRNNCVLLKPSSAAASTGSPTVTIAYGGTGSNYYVNPTTNTTFYARVIVFSNSYTTVVDSGSVASATVDQIAITAKVQEKLAFSVSSNYTANVGTACTTLPATTALALGDVNGVLDSGTSYDAFSYFRISTNALNGTVVQYSGDTLKSTGGANSITALTSETLSTRGTSQFGLGLNTVHADHSFTNLVASTAYDEANGAVDGAPAAAKFNFATGSLTTPVTIASAPTATTITCDTGVVRYAGNISTTTPPGIYTTAISYIAVPTY
jgi:hypothetical protein